MTTRPPERQPRRPSRREEVTVSDPDQYGERPESARGLVRSIAFTCPCGAHVTVPDQLAGQTTNCPQCQAPLPVPTDVERLAHAMLVADDLHSPPPDGCPTAEEDDRSWEYSDLKEKSLRAALKQLAECEPVDRPRVKLIEQQLRELSPGGPGGPNP